MGEIIPFKEFGLEVNANRYFEPPKLPMLLEIRKCMGLTLEEAASVLATDVSTLSQAESVGYSERFSHLDEIMHRYRYFLTIHREKRERNIACYCISLREARVHCYRLSYYGMGIHYGFTSRQWYNFEMHNDLLPRNILAEIDQRVRQAAKS